MARVPNAESLGLGQGPAKVIPLQGRLQVQASPADFGAQQAQQIGGFGQDIGQAGQQLWRAQQAVAERDARIQAAKAGGEARLAALDYNTQLEANAPPGAPGHVDGLNKWWQDYTGEHLKGVKAGRYRDLVQQEFDQTGLWLHERGLSFQTSSKKAKDETDAKSLVDIGSGIVMRAPEMFGPELANRLKLIEASNLAPPLKAKAAQDMTHALAKAFYLGSIEKDPRGTLGLLQSGQEPMGLEADDFVAVLDRARVRVNALDAEDRRANTENRAAAKVALEAANDDRVAKRTDGVDPGPAATDAEWEAAYGPTWQVAKARYQDKYRRADALGGLVGMSLPEIRQTLIDRRPNPALPEYARQQDEYRVLVQAAQETERQIRADPAAFAVRRSPAVAQAYQNAGGDAVKLGQAVALSLQVQREMGVPETELQPLPKQQAEVTGRNLVAITDPQQQVAQVRAVLGTIPDKAIRKRFAASLEGEGGLPKGFTRAVDALERGDAPAAVRIMTALKGDMKIADKSTRDNVGTVLDNEVARGNRGQVARLQGLWTGDNRELAQLRDERELAERLAAYSVSGGAGYDAAARQAANDVWGRNVPLVADPNLAAVTLPTGTDAEAVKLGLARIRAAMPIDTEDVRRALDPEGKGGAITQQGAQQLVDDWKDQARWVNDDERFALLIPVPQRDANGKLTGTRMVPLPGHRWTLDEVLSLAHPSTAATVSVPSGRVEEPVPAPSPAPTVANPLAPDRAALHAAVEQVESGGANVVAIDPGRAPEDRAAGPMQVMPETAREVAGRMGIAELQGLDNRATQAWMLAHPDQARAIGQHYLDEQLDRYGDPALAAAAYTAGPGNVDKWLEDYGDPRTGEVTLAFWLRKVRAAGNPKTASYVTKVVGALA